MAEAIGLVFGGVSLVSLFSTFIQVHDYFEELKSFSEDVELVFTKVNVIKERLQQWARSISRDTLGEETAKALDTRWPEQRGIQECLQAMQRILGLTVKLCHRYRYRQKRQKGQTAQASLFGLLPSSPSQLFVLLDNPTGSLVERPKIFKHKNSSLKLRCIWVFAHKRRIGKLINELDFLLNNLEKVTENLRQDIISNSPNTLPYHNCPKHSQSRSKRLLEQAPHL